MRYQFLFKSCKTQKALSAPPAHKHSEISKTPQAIPHLVQALQQDRDSSVRAASAQALGNLKNPQATPHLIKALGDFDGSVRQSSAEALGKIKDTAAVPALSLVLHCQATEKVSRVALEQMNQSPLPLDAAIQWLIAADEWGVLIRALTEVSEVEKAFVALSAPAIPHFTQALLDADRIVRAASAQALGDIKDPQAIPHLFAALVDEADRVRKACANALVQIGEPAFQYLAQKLHDENPLVRYEKSTLLISIIKPSQELSIGVVIQALQNAHAGVRRAGAFMARELRLRAAVPRLIQLLWDENRDVYRESMEALAVIGDRDAVPALQKKLAETTDIMERDRIEQAILRIKRQGV